MLMMEPLVCSSAGRHALVIMNTERTRALKQKSRSSISQVQTFLARVAPALFNKMSSRSKYLIVESTILVTSSCFVTSPMMVRMFLAETPASLHFCAVLAKRSASLPVNARRLPHPAKAMAHAAPIPLLAPGS